MDLTKKNEASQEQIDAWKAEHGDVYKISVEDKVVYLHKPSRKTLSYATSVAAKDPIKFNEIILAGCWLGGDPEVKTDDSYFLSVSAHLGDLIQVKEAEMLKLERLAELKRINGSE